MNLLRYIFRRLVMAIPVVCIVFMTTFFLSRIMPGNPFLKESISLKGNPEVVRMQLEYFGLDQPLYIQFYQYMKCMFQGDWGVSLVIAYNIPVWELIREKLPLTLEISV